MLPKNPPKGNYFSRAGTGKDDGTGDVGELFTPDEIEFMLAMEKYMRHRNRPYPDVRDVLIVAKELGYAR